MPASDIVINGAREHNLRDVDVILPRNQLICLTGVSGSGKSSLAFDTLFAEGQRRYIESLSSFARQFLGQLPKPDVDLIAGLSPSISISQKTSGRNPRSTVGTITEIYDYLRVLFARVGQGYCPRCDRPITAQTREQIIARVMQLPEKTAFSVLAPIIRGQKGEWRDLFVDLLKQGFTRARVDGAVVSLNDDLNLDRQMRHDIEVVVDRLTVKKEARPRLAEAIDLAIKMGKGNLIVALDDGATESQTTAPKKRRKKKSPSDMILSVDYACTHCDLSFEPPSPQLFSFNSPRGMCDECDGLGKLYTFDPELLVPKPKLSFKKGAISLVGKWSDNGRWRRHIFQGVADTIERLKELPEGTMLDTPWEDLDPALQELWLWGTGDEHITYTWRGGSSPVRHGGEFEGIIPELLEKYRTNRNKMQIRKLEKHMRTLDCPSCRGERLNHQARAVRVETASKEFETASLSLPQICQLSVADAAEFFSELVLDSTKSIIAVEAIKEIHARLGFLLNVGLEYLTLDRTAPTLSGGESQRIRLAGQIGSGLVGVVYILDEPSIGLHPRDNDRLINTLARLRDMGNTVVVVEHDEDTMRAADHIVDFGPGPGIRGGEVVAIGTADEISKEERSVTGAYLSGASAIEIPDHRRDRTDAALTIVGARHNNLKNIDVEIPLGQFVCVTGVSGSGKSSLINDILSPSLRGTLHRAEDEPGEFDRLDGIDNLDKVIAIDQSPIGRTPRSNPGTYIKVFDDIRNLFAQLPESKKRGFKPGRFSFNVKSGRCEACEGNGANKLAMDFLADVWVTCPVCQGHRFNRETLQVQFKGKSIADVLELDIQQALELFENVPKIAHKLQTLHDVGLDYLKIGQPSPTLSGGEAQRIKLARELVKKSTGKTLYLLDEPTTGLHFADIHMLLKVLQDFVDAGNTVLVVEHNLDVIKSADWVIDLGPEGGAGGGRIISQGRPEDIAECAESETGVALKAALDAHSNRKTGKPTPAKRRKKTKQATLAKKITVQGASQHNLKGVDVEIERDAMTVFCGPSGSGKSSLAMDTIYAEGQRRYVESLSSYARQFVSQMQKPALDHIDGLSPAVAIEQKNLSNTPRSTVGTVTEIYDYLRILMARLATPYCPDCDLAIGTQTTDQVVDKIMAEEEGTRLYLMAPIDVEVGQSYDGVWADLKAAGYTRARIDGATHSLDSPPEIDRRRKHDVAAIIDRIVVKPSAHGRIAESVETALSMGHGIMTIAFADPDVDESKWRVETHSQHLACEGCGRSFEPLTPHHFSFNSSIGWCPACEGIGSERGANPAALLRDPKKSLADGAVDLWPDLSFSLSQRMLQALSAETGIPLDTPFDQLPSRFRRIVLHGAGAEWISVPADESGTRFQFQFKGVYPALEEASRLSPSLRNRLADFVDEVDCSTCSGSRLRDDAAASRFRNLTMDELCRMPLDELQPLVAGWKLKKREQKIAGEVLREIVSRLQFLNDVGLEYVSLSRKAATLSGGEAQRIRLASQLGSGLCGVLYVLDEPTIGLHPRDNDRLLGALHKLRDLGNTLLVVEHDREVIANSDAICDFGPAAGKHGGEIIAHGTPKQVARRKTSNTGPYLTGKKSIAIPANRRIFEASSKAAKPSNGKAKKKDEAKRPSGVPFDNDTAKLPAELAEQLQRYDYPQGDFLTVIGARHNNLQTVDVALPLGAFIAVTGPSGCGKSSLVDDVLHKAIARKLHRASTIPGAHDDILGLEHINKVIQVNQQAIGNSPTSNPATYTGLFELIRQLFARLPESKLRGFSQRRFSFNAPGGRCETCEGNGQICIEMHFLPDVWVDCETCRGARYNPETLAVQFQGRNISEVLDMTCGEALELFGNIPKIRRILQTLCDVGLDYVTLGQPAPTLSGGEAQRVKLASELSRPDTGRTLYLLDEPTTGLHFNDLAKLLEVLQRLVDLGNTVVVIEHNLDVIKQCDWVIDMGPEAGEEGGRVVVAGTPEDVAAYSAGKSNETLRSYTGEALAPVIAEGPYVAREVYDPEAATKKKKDDIELRHVGADSKMPWEIDGRGWHVDQRVDRKGKPVQWDGRILAEVVDAIQDLGDFNDTNWSNRTVVEITGPKKTEGWFFHAITAETFLVKMKFRVPKNTFEQRSLSQQFDLPTLNQMDELPVYGNASRVKVRNRGRLQEVEIRAHSWEEINKPVFHEFLAKAAESFEGMLARRIANPDEATPWKKLGEEWHLMRKGFRPGRKIHWEPAVLERLRNLLLEICPDGEFYWKNQVLTPFFQPDGEEPWARIATKRHESLDLTLYGPKNAFGLGRVAELGVDRAVDGSKVDYDAITISFRTVEQINDADLTVFLKEHLKAVQA